VASTQNYSVVRQCYEQVINRGNIDAVDEYFAPNFVEHAELLPGLPKNREGLKRYFTTLRKAFKDLHFEVEDEIVQEDKVVLRIRAEGSQQEEFLGIPSSGKHVQFPLIGIYRIANGKVAEHWGLADQQTALRQLGITKPASNMRKE
jgi:steroid delta-isomerase-like uncharacterized protein